MSEPQQSLLDILGVTCRMKIVDIGANPIDDEPPYAGLLAAGVAEVVGFEPSPDALAVLLEKKGPNETYLPHAIADGKEHSLQLCFAPGMNSLLEPDPDVLGLLHGGDGWSVVLSRQPVETVRLDDVPETEGIDYVKIDIQGAELMAFENATERLKGVSIIHTEVEFLPIYKDQPLFSDVDRFLRSQGFLLHQFRPLRSRALKPLVVGGCIFNNMSQVSWADAVYLRSILDLAAYPTEKLLVLAVILHDCYGSYDVAHYLLVEYDRRQETRHAPVYLGMLTGSAAEAA